LSAWKFSLAENLEIHRVVSLMTDDVGEVVLIYEQVVDETFSAEDGADAEDLTI
jgi:hypothetical protein